VFQSRDLNRPRLLEAAEDEVEHRSTTTRTGACSARARNGVTRFVLGHGGDSPPRRDGYGAPRAMNGCSPWSRLLSWSSPSRRSGNAPTRSVERLPCRSRRAAAAGLRHARRGRAPPARAPWTLRPFHSQILRERHRVAQRQARLDDGANCRRLRGDRGGQRSSSSFARRTGRRRRRRTGRRRLDCRRGRRRELVAAPGSRPLAPAMTVSRPCSSVRGASRRPSGRALVRKAPTCTHHSPVATPLALRGAGAAGRGALRSSGAALAWAWASVSARRRCHPRVFLLRRRGFFRRAGFVLAGTCAGPRLRAHAACRSRPVDGRTGCAPSAWSSLACRRALGRAGSVLSGACQPAADIGPAAATRRVAAGGAGVGGGVGPTHALHRRFIASRM